MVSIAVNVRPPGQHQGRIQDFLKGGVKIRGGSRREELALVLYL